MGQQRAEPEPQLRGHSGTLAQASEPLPGIADLEALSCQDANQEEAANRAA